MATGFISALSLQPTFFDELMQSETVNTKAKTKKTTPDMWQQTVAEYIVENLETPVSGDTVAINNDWSLVVKDVDEKGRTIGLKYK